MNDNKKRLNEALLKILQLDITNVLKQFLEGEVGLLFLLYRKNSTLSPSEIAKNLNLSKGRVASLINSLCDKEFIDVTISTEDRRSFNVSLTNKGLEYLQEKMNYADQYFDRMLTKLGEEKSNVLIDIINETVTLMEEE